MPAPLEQPLSYPGERPGASFLLRGDIVGPLPTSFDVTGRRRVLAIGSNACPAQLAVKFRGRACSDVVAGEIVDVGALAVRPSAHFGRSGYWPFAPARSDDAVTRCVLLLLDDAQVAVLDRTEPNYERIALDPAVHRLRTTDDAIDTGVEVYVSRHGVVDDDRLPRWTDPPPSQHALLDALRRTIPDDLPGVDAETLSAAVRSAPTRADDVTAAIRQHLRVRPAALAGRGTRGATLRTSDAPAG